MSQLRILALTRYGPMGASSRLRSMQYWPFFRESGISVEAQAFFDDDTLSMRYQRGGHSVVKTFSCYLRRIKALLSRRNYDLIWIEKEALPWLPVWVESALLRGVPYVMDFDDALFHNYDLHRFALVRCLLGRRLDKLMKNSALVVCGNEYLAGRARSAGASRVELVPTVIDLQRYPSRPVSSEHGSKELPRIVWIGSPSTQKYLQILSQPLQRLAKRVPFVLRIIGGSFELPGVQVETVRWTEESEVSLIAECDVGVMPLLDLPWEQGKCGYKLIQYMACGLPVVASPVGVNVDIVNVSANGFLASTELEWEAALETLLMESQTRQEMGRHGRLCVEQNYCLQITAPRLAQMLRLAAGVLTV